MSQASRPCQPNVELGEAGPGCTIEPRRAVDQRTKYALSVTPVVADDARETVR